MEDQGITSLAPQQGDTAESEKLFKAAQNSVSPQDLAKGTMENLSQDPALAEAVDELMSLSLPPEMIQGLLSILEIVLKNPGQYDQIRQYAISQGLPEDLLPEAYDAEYLQMLKMTMDALSAEGQGMGQMQEPQQFAEGGQPETAAAIALKKQNENVSTLASEIKNQYESLVGQVPDVAYKGRQSDLDRIFNAQATKLANKGVTSITNLRNVDGNLVDSSTGTVISRIKQDRDTGATKWGDAFGGVEGGANFAVQFAGDGSAVLFPVYEKSKSLGQQIQGSIKKIVANPLGKLAVGVGLAFLTGGASLTMSSGLAGALSTTLGGALAPSTIAGALGAMGASALAGDSTKDIIKNGFFGGMAGSAYGSYTAAGGGVGGPYSTDIASKFGQGLKATGQTLAKAPTELGNLLTGGSFEGAKGLSGLIPTAVGGTALAYGLGAFDKDNPSPEDLGLGFERDVTPTQKSIRLADDPRYKVNLGNIETSYSPRNVNRTPFTPASYTGIAPMSPLEESNGIKALSGYAFGGAVDSQIMQGAQRVMSQRNMPQNLAMQRGMRARQEIGAMRARQNMANGGIASMKQPVYGYVGGGTPQYPRRTGEIAGPGTGTSDDIPAMLSDGEFVFTAKAVRNMGGGDRKEGAKRMYAAMKKLEQGGMA